jgi:hypothetical protein
MRHQSISSKVLGTDFTARASATTSKLCPVEARMACLPVIRSKKVLLSHSGFIYIEHWLIFLTESQEGKASNRGASTELPKTKKPRRLSPHIARAPGTIRDLIAFECGRLKKWGPECATTAYRR